MPPKTDYTTTRTHKRPLYTSRSSQQVWRPRAPNGGATTSNSFAVLMAKGEGEKGDNNVAMKPPPSPRRENMDEDGFQLVMKRRGKHGLHASPSRQGLGDDVIPSKASACEKRKGADRQVIGNSGGWGYLQKEEDEGNIQTREEGIKSRYYRQLDNGDFDTRELDEEVEMEEATPTGIDNSGGWGYLQKEEDGVTSKREKKTSSLGTIDSLIIVISTQESSTRK